MIPAVNRRFFPKGPKIASDKSAFSLFQIDKNSSMDNRPNTKPTKKALRWAFIKRMPISKTTTITYLGLGNRVTVSIGVKFRFRVRVIIRLIR